MSRLVPPSPGADWSDREERLVASVLRIVAITFTSSAVVWVATSLLTGVQPLYAALGLPIIIGGLVSFQLIRRGRLRMASWIVVLVPWAVLLTSAALQGVVSTPVLGGSIVLIIAVGLLLGTQPALVFALVSGLSFAIAEAQSSGSVSTLPELVRLGLSLFYLAGCALLSGFAAA